LKSRLKSRLKSLNKIDTQTIELIEIDHRGYLRWLRMGLSWWCRKPNRKKNLNLTHEIMVLQNFDVKVSDWHPWNRRRESEKKRH
jgi:hypothetical protein